MRLRFRIAAIAVLVAVSAGVSAQEFFVAYLEGEVEYRDGSRWVECRIGDSLAAGTEVRLSDDGFLEVVRGNRTFRYAAAGTYRLAGDAAGAPSAGDTTDLGGLIRATVSRFTRSVSPPSERAISAGVRASEAAQEPSIDWVGDDSPEELIEEGVGALTDGAVEDASFLFEDAFSFAEGATRERAGFFFVYTLYLLAEYDLAFETLAEFSPDTGATYFPDFALVAAEVYHAVGELERAVDLLDTALRSHPAIDETQPLTAQAIYFLLGESVAGSDPDRAGRSYARAAEIAPTTTLGREAATRSP